MPAILYSSATRTQWFANAYPGTSITPNCVAWHTTETGGWPSYGGGASAPHFTYNPAVREMRQHFPVNRSARALRNLSGGVETNTLNVVQIEIVAYSDEVLAAHRGHRAVSHLRPEHLADLGDWARWLHDEWGIRLDIDPGWVTSNYTNPKRMSFSQWRGFYGHTGHNRVPENTHWDPARLDIWSIIANAEGSTTNGDTMSWDETLTPTKTAASRFPDGYSTKAEHVIMHILGLTYHLNWGKIRFNAWMRERWADQSLSPRVLLRSGYGHSREAKERVRDQVLPLLREIRAAQGSDERDQVLADIQADLATAQAERQSIGDRLDVVTDLLEQVGSGDLSAEQLVEALRQMLHQVTAPDDETD